MPDNYVNATMGITEGIAGFSNGSSWFSVMMMVGIVTVLILLFVIAMSSITRYRKIRGTLKWFVDTIQYFFFGIGGLGVLAVPTLILFYFGSQAKQGNTVPIEMTLAIIGGYFLIAGLGYIFKRLIADRIKLFEEVIQDEKALDEIVEEGKKPVKKETKKKNG